MTLTSLSRAMSWMLNGPVMLSELAMALAMRLTALIVPTYSFCAGSTSVASPEWTPAFSTCSEMA
jgi:hypothetical protein